MSEQNVELVRAFSEAFEAFAGGGVDAVVGFLDPEINWRAAEGALDDVGEMHGTQAWRRYVQDWVEMFDDLEFKVVEVRDLGDDRVLAVQRMGGKAKLSGARSEITFAVVYTFRDGKIVRGREYMTREEALKAIHAAGE